MLAMIAMAAARVARIGAGVVRGTAGLVTGVARASMGPRAWGIGALLPGKLGALKFALPLAGIGAYAAAGATSDLLTKTRYDIDSPRVRRMGAPGAPMTDTPSMEFSTFRRSYLDSNATGSLMFALHNRR